MTQLTILTERNDAEIVLHVSGPLDLSGGDVLELSVTPLLDDAARVVLELADVPFIDSSGLAALIALQQAARDGGRELVIRSPSDAVARVLDITQTAPVFEVDDTA